MSKFLMIDLDLLKMQLRIETDNTGEDVYLEHLAGAVIDAFTIFTNRILVNSTDDIPDPVENYIVKTKGIEQGALMLASHWYANRESVSIGMVASELPLATERLWAPHRWRKL